jgi:hypothetical protein
VLRDRSRKSAAVLALTFWCSRYFLSAGAFENPFFEGCLQAHDLSVEILRLTVKKNAQAVFADLKTRSKN